MSKKRAGSASVGGTPANNADSGSDDDEQQQQQGQQQLTAQQKGKQAAKAGGGGAAGGGGGGADTDLNALDDAIGLAGVDLHAEEEAIRAQNYRAQQQQQQQQNRAKVRPHLILDENALKDLVLRIAASFHLKNLESDSLPLIGLAVQMRMRALIEQMIQAKDYRVHANHLRPPPVYPAEGSSDAAPMWDAVIYDDVEKILSTFDRVEREEERQARKDRLARDQAEQEERERLERLAEEHGGDIASVSAMLQGGSGDMSMADSSMGGTPGSMPGTPAGRGASGADGTKPPKEKKRKKETPMQTAKNMSEDVRKRLSDQTASRKLGGKRFSWLSGGPGDSPWNKKALPRPKFPPLPPSSLSISTSAAAGGSGTPGGGVIGAPLPSAGLDGAGPVAGPSGAFGRLPGIPAAHEASRAGPTSADPANRLITIRDALFVMEQERGKGAGAGSGTRQMTRAYMGRT